MNDVSRGVPEYYTGKPDFSDVNKLIEAASAEALPVDGNPLKPTYEADRSENIGRAATTATADSSFFKDGEVLSELQRTIREIKAIGLKLQQCRSEALGRGVDGNV